MPNRVILQRAESEMADAKVFYSWQSDLPSAVTRSFIERSLEKACKEIGKSLAIDLGVDQDARGKEGSPGIADSVQGKIRSAAAVVADLSIVQRRPSGGGLTNGCVAVEWGWAEEALGSEALIGVMNLAFGGAGELPIDIRQHLVRGLYELEQGSAQEQRVVQRDKLTKQVTTALDGSIRSRFFRGIHPGARAWIGTVVRQSDLGIRTEEIAADSLAEQVGKGLESLIVALEDLERLGLVLVKRGLGEPIPRVQFEPLFFARFDPLYMGWNAAHDAATIAAAVAERSGLPTRELAKEMAWSRRRINPAIAYLIHHRLVDIPMARGDHTVVADRLKRNLNTLAFAEGRLPKPALFDIST